METKDLSMNDSVLSVKDIENRLKQLRRIKQKSEDLKVHHDTDNLDEDER